MGKLFIRNFLSGIIFMVISAIIATGLSAGIGAISLSLSFNAIFYLIIGAIIGIECCIILSKHLIKRTGYFLPKKSTVRKMITKKSFLDQLYTQ